MEIIFYLLQEQLLTCPFLCGTKFKFSINFDTSTERGTRLTIVSLLFLFNNLASVIFLHSERKACIDILVYISMYIETDKAMKQIRT